MNKLILQIFLLIIFLLPISSLNAESNKELAEKRKKEILKDKMLFNSAQGREFWIAVPPNEVPGYQPNVLELYITSGKKTNVTLESPTMGVNLTKKVDPMKITTFSSTAGEVTFQWEVRESEQITDKGLRLVADQPISVYVLNAKTYTSEGYLALPLSAWGTSYLHLAYYDFSEIEKWAGGFIVLSAYEDTRIKIDLQGVGSALTWGGRKLGETIRETLSPGQTYMVRGDGLTRGAYDLSGTKISANKPIGLISFHMRTIIPSFDIYNGRDCLSEMLPPIQAWGKKYSTVEYKRDSGKGDFFRIIASEDNTDFKCEYFDIVDNHKLGTWQGQLKKAGNFLEYLEAVVTVGHTLKSIRGTSVFEATKPVLVMQYAYSADWDGNAIFDPFMIIVVPVEQYIPATVFQTPANKAFMDNWFNIIAIGDTADPKRTILKTVKLDDRAIYIDSPSFLYNQIPNSNLFWAKINVMPGAHKVTSDTKFGGYIYGFSNWDSYGWPAAMAINKLDETDTLEPQLYPSEICGNYTIRSTEFRNGNQGDDPRQVDQGINDVQLLDGSNNYKLELPPLIPFPPVYDYTFKLLVEDPFAPAFGLYAVTDRAGNVALDSVRYEPDSLALDPELIAFGDVRLRTDKDLTAKLKNISDSSITIKSVRLQKSTVFKITSDSIPPQVDVNSGKDIEIAIRYTPDVEGLTPEEKDKDTLIVETDCLTFKWEVNGRGVVPRIQVEDWHAGAVILNKTVCKTQQTGTGLMIKNPGTMPVTITGIKGIVPPFSISVPSIPAVPFTIAPGETIYLESICFTPPDTNSYSINVTFENNGEGIDSVSNWTGRGLNPGPYISSYNWHERRVGTKHLSKVYLKNAGNSALTVTDVIIDPPDPNYSVDKANIWPPLPVDITPEGSGQQDTMLTIPVIFTPKADGYLTSDAVPVFTDKSIPAGSVRGKLEGIGFTPGIIVTGDTILPPIIVNSTHPNKGIVTIKSTSDTALFIEKIIISPASPNASDFSFDPANMPPSNIVLAKGAEIKVPLIFKPTFINERKVIIDVLSDACPGTIDQPEPQEPRIWNSAEVVGYAFDKGIEATSINYGEVLRCDLPIDSFIIKNTSSSTFTRIDSLGFISGDKDAFSIQASFPQDIQEKSQISINVGFLHNSNKTGYKALYRIYNDGGASDTYTEFEGTVKTVNVDFFLDTLRDMAPGYFTDLPYKKFPVSVRSINWDAAKITRLEFDIMYKSKWLNYLDIVGKGELTKASSWSLGGSVSSVDEEWSKLTVKCSTDNPDDYLKSSGAITSLCYPKFLILLSDVPVFEPYIGRITFFDKDSCVISSPDTGLISFDICVENLRNVIFPKNGLNYVLQDIKPNPITAHSFTIDYSVALKGSQTILQVFNSNNELINTLVDNSMDTGTYSINVSTESLASGVYYVYMKSGPFTDIKRFVITK